MKKIQPIVFPLNLGIATIFNLIGINDNLIDNATFIYQLYTAENIQLQADNIVMSGTDYAQYSSSADSNLFAYQWATTQLGITLL